MHIHVSYDLLGNGWSTCFIRVDQMIHQINITHVFSSPIEDCMFVLKRMIKGEKKDSFIWYDEPGGTKFKIVEILKKSGEIKITATQFENSYGEEIQNEKLLFEFIILKRIFFKMMYYEFLKIANLLSEKKFAENKRKDFPFNSFKTFEKSVLDYV
ncbi:hypothetical protein KORDIASMS9_02224 [Kordia sp. SMS9]|uniref:hypothetical protein n=1 Tax=Kordia sp. SMS9 TaxID=2282170 RepID=UPI000E109CAA|nr:hypothetical protein [Kordia sp. SMS9]AXG69995.1 hypothetical protein KORDIASMS9_02224 [Kordia sp. SMS9]